MSRNLTKVVLIFRKSYNGQHSIEELFSNIKESIDRYIDIRSYTLSKNSNGIINRIYTIFETYFNRGKITHITGDVHFVNFLLKKRYTILTIHDLGVLKVSKGIKKIILFIFWFWIPCKKSRFVTVISEFTKKELLKELNIPCSKIKVIPNPVSSKFSFVANENISLNRKIKLLQVGTKYNKNLSRVIQAIVGLNVQLEILGNLSGSQISMLNKYNIEFKSYQNLTLDAVTKLYAKVDIVVFVSLYEGFGMPIIEAQATGRPVITSNICSMPDVAGDGAILVNPYSVKDIRDNIIKVMEDRELYLELVNRGRRNVQKYKTDSVASQYMNLYKELLNDK